MPLREIRYLVWVERLLLEILYFVWVELLLLEMLYFVWVKLLLLIAANAASAATQTVVCTARAAVALHPASFHYAVASRLLRTHP